MYFSFDADNVIVCAATWFAVPAVPEKYHMGLAGGVTGVCAVAASIVILS